MTPSCSTDYIGVCGKLAMQVRRTNCWTRSSRTNCRSRSWVCCLGQSPEEMRSLFWRTK